jgi:hypothetical protein
MLEDIKEHASLLIMARRRIIIPAIIVGFILGNFLC